MEKWTKAEWTANLYADGGFSIEAAFGSSSLGLLVLASRGPHPSRAEEMHANAKLMAAAPDVYAALVWCERTIALAGWEGDESAIAARAALAKARGEA